MPSSLTKADRLDNGEDGADIAIPQMRDVDDAAYRIAHEYPGKVEGLALRMGVSASTLNKKVSPNNTDHKVSVADAVHMQVAANRFDILYAMSAALEHVSIPVPDQDHGQLARRLAKVGSEVGDVFRKTEKALADGRISPRERRELTKEVTEAITALAAVLKVL